MQLVQAACKADKLQRALDIVKLMHNPATVDAASKVAGFYHLPGLQEKIGLVREVMEDRKREREHAEARSRRSAQQHSAMIASERAAGASSRDTTFAPRRNFSRRTGAARVAAESPYPDMVDGSFIAETPEVEVESFPLTRDYSSPPQESKRKRTNDDERPREVMSPQDMDDEPPAKRSAQVETSKTDHLMGPTKTGKYTAGALHHHDQH